MRGVAGFWSAFWGGDTSSEDESEVTPLAVSAVEAGSMNQDRVAVLSVDGALVLVLADGAGGRSGGTEAAEGVVRLVSERAWDLVTGGVEPAKLLATVDATLAKTGAGGEATAVLAVVRGRTIHGASVGDSGCWLVTAEGVRNLTRNQVRKPMVGVGAANPVAFGPATLVERLLLASDGLLKYTSPEVIQKAALAQPLQTSAWALIETVRLPSGNLQDDVSIILCGTENGAADGGGPGHNSE